MILANMVFGVNSDDRIMIAIPTGRKTSVDDRRRNRAIPTVHALPPKGAHREVQVSVGDEKTTADCAAAEIHLL